MAGAGAGAGSGAEPPRERRAPLGKEREAAEAEEPRQSQELLGAGSSGGSREDGVFREPEPGFAELERRLSDFSLTSAVLQQVLRGFKETLQRELGSDTGFQLHRALGWDLVEREGPGPPALPLADNLASRPPGH
ncbi:uncharacterized protein LOC142070329 isoform X4 [Caretta caretta]|uniref:uncharacterized protein LOC142070329 isoform X4 n=2 Tax=Caretta caretta TaxID=8467 RepID=UPI003F4B96C9